MRATRTLLEIPSKTRLALPALALVFALSLAGGGCRRASPPVTTGPVDPDSRRTISTGEVVGFQGRYASHVWLGIPYAAAPVGPRRWRAPEPPPPWTGERAALAPGNACPQFPSIFGGVEGDDPASPVGNEDCLYLNVYAPRLAPGEVPPAGRRLPVLFWIHGGGNVIGQAAGYDGGHLAAAENVVVVALNYRLGPLGWLRHAALRAGSASAADRSGNYGTLDLVRGLEWVRENAAAFGGDPRNVTIFGESAGGRDVFSLLIAPPARGLFQRAIVQSGGTGTVPVEEAENLADATAAGHRNSSGEVLLRLLRAEGKAASRREALARVESMGAAEIERYLRAKPARELLLAYRAEDQEGLIEVPQLFRDGAVLPAGDPLEALRADGKSRVPIVFGTNRDENKLFLAVNREFVRNLFGVLPLVRDRTRFEATARHLSALWKATGADQPATVARAARGPIVWVYRFDWDEEPRLPLVDVSRLLGAAHGFEIPFVFGHWDLGRRSSMFFGEENRAAREELSGKMISYWTTFARAGDPGRGRDGSLPRWEPFEPEPGRFLVFDTEAGGGVRMESGLVTIDGVFAGVERDPDLATKAAKCDVYRRLVEWGRGASRERYASLCAEYPLPIAKID